MVAATDFIVRLTPIEGIIAQGEEEKTAAEAAVEEAEASAQQAQQDIEDNNLKESDNAAYLQLSTEDREAMDLALATA